MEKRRGMIPETPDELDKIIDELIDGYDDTHGMARVAIVTWAISKLPFRRMDETYNERWCDGYDEALRLAIRNLKGEQRSGTR